MSESFKFGAEASEANEQGAQEAFANRLAELRTIPGCPSGEDGAILDMSLPPRHTAAPNPFLTEWLKDSVQTNQPSEEYEDPGPFAADISEGKGHALYKAHSFHTKVPHQAIMRFILHYTRPGDVVLDAFCGSGMTGVAAQACGAPEPKIQRTIETEMSSIRWGSRRAVLQDLSPAATFIAAGMNLPIDAKAFDRRSAEILDAFNAEWGWMYETHHTDGRPASIDYTVWSQVFTCPNCGDEVVFYKAAFEESTGGVRDRFSCPKCGAHLTKEKLERRLEQSIDPTLKVPTATIKRVPVRIAYRFVGGRYEKRPDDEDLGVLERISSIPNPGMPTEEIPYMHMTHERNNLRALGITHFPHFWSPRARLALGALWKYGNEEQNSALRLALLFWIEQSLWGLSWMNRYRPEGYSQVSQYQSGVYYVPALHSECSVRYNLEGSSPSRGKRQSLVKVWESSPARPAQAIVSTGSSTHLELPNASIDYIFVDPPFGENIYYPDLDYLTETWHGIRTNADEEAIVSRSKVEPRTLADYQELMEGCFREFNRVLKPGRWMTVEFSNSSNEVWLVIQEALSRAGFVVADTRIFDKSHHSYRQVTAKNAVKQDLIISSYKPAEELEERFSIVAGSEEGAWEFIREHLAHLERFERNGREIRIVRERQEDRLYDRMVAFHVHHGVVVPLTAAEFYAGVEHRFPVRDEMFFLPEQVEAYERKRMTIKDLVQTELFITNEASAILWLRQQLKRRSRTFAEIQPPFFDELQAGLAEWENLPDLKQLLDENFLQDEQGRWYVPDPRKTSDLEKIRTKALLREFNRYLETKGKLTKFRSEAVRAGFKEAWGQRDFHMIISVGNRLPQDAFAEDQSLQHYYNNAQRLAR